MGGDASKHAGDGGEERGGVGDSDSDDFEIAGGSEDNSDSDDDDDDGKQDRYGQGGKQNDGNSNNDSVFAEGNEIQGVQSTESEETTQARRPRMSSWHGRPRESGALLLVELCGFSRLTRKYDTHPSTRTLRHPTTHASCVTPSLLLLALGGGGGEGGHLFSIPEVPIMVPFSSPCNIFHR
jgi:hypothetical protein